ncbi:MAG: hypothetical protein COZ34_01315 [Candidatus Pacebacteria bacterium CG_4_10_14_3_um_filter_34_15]|nr:hypothetical protein [Candidatus Pacearchaeota archaeon]NCQ65303.1 hypothetical protein [Candidatus Paceibacterota bacterium]OIO44976.1 MAG: hypothetical protein AUJ41_00895 [Candidatus Pacebacteria bacterium CG1_02_43_31]PIX81898.1 MAG: hypothetical protein COZ34_01315 [Candidatus Pacebacteria bacterium CG_4_10_14_3_um_filter_34_15]PJC44113.1 MAG: hypothetical protein CO039_00995 [Candidatus Pacebacteria bacterium CG_4_9_14_0_2_um_filter_34_50]
MKKILKVFGPFFAVVLLALALTACGSIVVPSETVSGDYVAQALATVELGSNLGAGIGWAVLAFVIGLVVAVAFFVWRGIQGAKAVFAAVPVFLVVALLVFAIPAARASYIVIDPGKVGVVVEQGLALDTPLVEGLHWITPFVQKVRVFSTRPFTFSLTSDGETSTPQERGSEQYRSFYQKFTTSNGVKGQAAYLVQASLDPQAAPQFYRDYGTLENGIVQLIKTPAIPLVRNVLRGLTATEVDTLIDSYNDEVMTPLCAGAKNGGLTCIDFAFSRPDMGTWGDERNLTAATEQQALTEKNKVEVAKQTALANVETEIGKNTVATNAAIAQALVATTRAKGEADAARITADATAYTTITEANAQAQANTVVSQTLTDLLIQYTIWTEWLGEWPSYMGGGEPLFTIPR